jgi:uncharacterized surface protein with fasciclin (FAS1) repeats
MENKPMTLRNRKNVVKRVASLGVLAASVAMALPVVAQMKPEAEMPAETAPTGEVKPSTEEMSAPTAGEPTTGEMSAPTAGEMSAPTSPSAQNPTSPEVTPETAPGTSPEVAPEVMPETTPEASPEESAATGETIVDVASASESFQTLVAALTEAELTEVLQGEGPFTVFAPTDEAFEALPPGSVEKLLQPENRALLVQILQYHVVSGAYPSEDLTSGEVATVEGQPVTVTVSEGGVKVNNANVIQPDITASNGVIHAIDQVIIPPGM